MCLIPRFVDVQLLSVFSGRAAADGEEYTVKGALVGETTGKHYICDGLIRFPQKRFCLLNPPTVDIVTKTAVESSGKEL